MKARARVSSCKRCDAPLSRYEKLHSKTALCAFCEHIRSEALEIYQKAHDDKKTLRVI